MYNIKDNVIEVFQIKTAALASVLTICLAISGVHLVSGGF